MDFEQPTIAVKPNAANAGSTLLKNLRRPGSDMSSFSLADIITSYLLKKILLKIINLCYTISELSEKTQKT